MSDWAVFYLVHDQATAPRALGELADDLVGEDLLQFGWLLREYEYYLPQYQYKQIASAAAEETRAPAMLMTIIESDLLHLSAFTPTFRWQGILPSPSDPPAVLLDRFEVEPLPSGVYAGEELATRVLSWCVEADLTPDHEAVVSVCSSKDDGIFGGARALDRFLDALCLRLH